ncbi:hypothetical protein ACFE04_028614 [Oxalis oulophora]
MVMHIDCSKCRRAVLPPVGAQSVRCSVCHAVTRVPPQQLPPPPPPGHKRAVICAVSYKDTDGELEGCINDAKYMKYMLINRFKFPEASILMLTEEEKDPGRIPTKKNIRRAMSWLVRGCKAGDSLVFHFSGHGTYKRNYRGDEVDGYDELLCPTDGDTQGNIFDNEINVVLVRPLPRGVKLHAIIDACHSGTALDLPFLCRMNRSGKYVWEDHRPRSGKKGTSGGEAICFSGCDDDQESADTQALAKGIDTGAMTHAFVHAIDCGHGTTYGKLLSAMRSIIRNAKPSDGPLTQEPQLTTHERFDVYSKAFSL